MIIAGGSNESPVFSYNYVVKKGNIMIHFDKDCEPASDIVVLKVLDNDILSSKDSGFVIADDALRNLRVGLYQVLKLGKKAKSDTGLEIGSYVYADKLASFYHTEPIALMRYNALIMETNADRTSYRALGGRVIVQEVKSDNETSSGFVVPTSNELKIGVIKSITPPYHEKCDCGENDECSNCSCKEELPFKVGDKILLTKDECDTLHGFTGDESLDPSSPIYIYKTESIICKINED